MADQNTPNSNTVPSLPANTPRTGLIDITELVGQLKDTWARWATDFVVAGAATQPWLSWLSLPVIQQLFRYLVNWIVGYVATGLEMEAFFLNTAIRKAAQAHDYISAVETKNNLPPTATDDEYKKAEQKEMAAFRNLVMVTA